MRILVLCLLLAACATQPAVQAPMSDRYSADPTYGVRHIASGAICPTKLMATPLRKATTYAYERAPGFDWCNYAAPGVEVFDIRIEKLPAGVTLEASLNNARAADLSGVTGYAESSVAFREQEVVGLTVSRAGSQSHGVWIAHVRDWRISLYADYAEARRDEVIAVARSYFVQLRKATR